MAPPLAYMGKYGNFEALKRHEKQGVDYEVHVRRGQSGIAVMAPHGGGIEPGTMDIADSVAGTEHTFYCFKGIKPSGNSDLHITSTAFDEPEGISIAKNADFILTIHGCSDKEEIIFIGGNDRHFIKRLSHDLTLAGFVVIGSPRPGLEGTKTTNLCNRGRTGCGVQLEISAGLRSKMLYSTRHEVAKVNSKVFSDFVEILRKSIKGVL